MHFMQRPSIAAVFLATLALPTAAQNLRFGSAVVVGDGEVIVAEATASYRPGTLYVYRKSGVAWKQAATLNAPNAEVRDNFGISLALAGNALFVGQGAGPVHIFRKATSGAWQAGNTITADAQPAERFGTAIAVDGDWLLVGAPGQVPAGGGGRRGGGGGGGGGGGRRGGGDAAPLPAGSVFVFQRAGDQWTQRAKLTASDAAPGDAFGAAISLVGGHALIGAPGKSERAGVVYEFRLDPATGVWTQSGPLQARTPRPDANFGSSVALVGEAAYVGVPGSEGGYGATLVLTKNADGQWQEQSRFAVSGISADRFGSTVVVDGSTVWIGAPGASPAGAAYLYPLASVGTDVDARGGGLTVGGAAATPNLLIARLDAGAAFGRAVALRGAVAAIGAPSAGAAAIFEKDARGVWRERAIVAPPPDAIAAVTGGEVKCDANGKARVFDCKDVDILGYLPIHMITLNGGQGTRMSGNWGWTDSKTGKEYALLGRNNGTSFVDVTDPKNPIFLGDLPLTPGARASSWREIKVYKDHAYIVSDGAGPHGMQVFDLTQLRTVKKPVTFEPTVLYTRINSAHNIVINEEAGFAYATGSSAGGETCGGGLHMMDIRDPKKPTFAGCFAHEGTGRRGTGYTHDAQCVNYKGPDTKYQGREICLNANETALSISDVTDKQAPKVVARAEYPKVGYTHQGWLTDDQKHFYVNDELDETGGLVTATRTLVWDLSSLENPRLAKEFLGTTQASDHNLYVNGNFMYQSNYAAGLRIIDITNREEPVEVAFLDTAPYSANVPGFGGTWSNYPFFKSGTLMVTSGGEGLFLLRKRPTPVM